MRASPISSWLQSAWSKDHRIFTILGGCCLAGAVLGFVALPRGYSRQALEAAAPKVEFLGRSLSPAEGLKSTILTMVRERVRETFQLELPDGRKIPVSYGKLGAQIDKVRLDQLARDVIDPTSPWRQSFAAQERFPSLKIPMPVVLDRGTAYGVMRRYKDEFDRHSEDARLDLEKRTLVKEITGWQLDLDESVDAIEVALSRGERSAALKFSLVEPRRKSSDLGDVVFDKVLAFFETPYDRANRAAARTYNLRLAASKLDGTVLMPGEIFDFNDVVGARDEAHGYKVATVIAQGELVDGIGGGTCQVSGTLHGAAFFAGLDVVERSPHTRPSSYIKMGMDATVVYPTINFRIRNPFDFPVVIHETVQGGVVRAEILGPKEGPVVTLIRKIDSALPYEQIERPDPKLPKGVKVLAQRGVPGFKFHRYRIVRYDEHARRQRWDDIYPPTTQIIRVGSGAVEPKFKAPAHDAHPEYAADELIVITQSFDEKSGTASFSENREAGLYGESGWTKKLGMPWFETKATN